MSDEELIVEPLVFFEKERVCFRKQHLGQLHIRCFHELSWR